MNKNMLFIIGIFIVIALSILIVKNVSGGGIEKSEATVSRESGIVFVSKGSNYPIKYSYNIPFDVKCNVDEEISGECKYDNKDKINLIFPGSNDQISIKVNGNCNITGYYLCTEKENVRGEGFLQTLIIRIGGEGIVEKCPGTCREECGEMEIKKEDYNDWCKKNEGKSNCCVELTCANAGGIWVKDIPEETAGKCLKDENNRPIIYTPVQDQDKHRGEICCKGKEGEREAPKKPGTLGRLGICFGLIPSEAESVNNTKKHLEEAIKKLPAISEAKEGESSIITEIKKSIRNQMTEISNLPKDSVTKVAKIDEINADITSIKLKLEELKKDHEEIIKNLSSVQDELDKAQDSARKIKNIHAVTGIECFFNKMSVAFGVLKAAGLTATDMGSCSAEQPLPGTDACLSCNEDPYRICTRERCEILGTCIPVPTVKGDQYNCIPGKCEELGLVEIKEGIIEWYINGEMAGTKKADISQGNIKTDIGKIPFNTKTLLINLTTDKPAQCRYVVDVRGANFSDMQDFEDNYFPLDPVTGKPGWQHAAILLPGDMARDATHRVFIKCKNACGVEPPAAYDNNIISFTFEKKPDQLPPEIVYVDPASNSMIRGDLAFVNVSIWLDELVRECKFSDKSNNYSIIYTSMIPFGSWNNENSSVIDGGCKPGKCLDRNEQCSRCWLLLNTSRGYDIVNFSSTEFNETKLFSMLIRCADVAGNVMVEDSILSYTLMTAPTYNISIIKPEHGNKTYDRKPEIEVTSEPRQTECRYRIFQTNRVPREELATMGGIINCERLNWSLMWPIDVGMSTLHKGRHNETLNATPSGLLHTLCVKCRDTWRIEESDRSDFYVLLDPTPPIVVRMYHDTTAGDYLIIETDEESECVYGTSDTIKCSYNFSDGSAMTTTNNYLHAAYWQLNSLYYIKCKDKWDNYPGGSSNANQCTIIINPFEIPQTI